MPSATRPGAKYSSSAIFSATRNGSFQGRIMAPGTSLALLVREAR